MTTGVDAQTCKYIILDSNINSMTEFKQIIGRGTRIREDYGKLYFTIIDFRAVTKLFADPDFDGAPVLIKEISSIEDLIPEEQEMQGNNNQDEINYNLSNDDELQVYNDFDGNDYIREKQKKYYVDNVEVKVINKRVLYYDNDGKLITESLEDYTKKNIFRKFRTLDDFLQRWNNEDKKTVIIKELEEKGVLFDELQEKTNKEIDPFDLICHIAFDMPPLTRKERAGNVIKRNYFTKYGKQVREVLETLLQKYADEGLKNLESIEILKIPEFSKFGSPIEIVKLFGGRNQYIKAIIELEKELYAA